MNKFLESKSLKKQLRLPFLKMRLEYNKRNNLEKKLDITLDEIYKQTGTLITRIDNFPSQFRNISHREYNELIPAHLKKAKNKPENNIYKIYQNLSKDSKILNKLKLTKTKEFHFNSMNDILRLRLKKYKRKKNEYNKDNFSQTSSLYLSPTHEKIKDHIFINNNLYDSNNSFEITLSKTNGKTENLKKMIVKKMPKINLSEKSINIKTIEKMYKMQSILSDTNKNFHNINYNLLNLNDRKNNNALNNLNKLGIKKIKPNEDNIQNITIENDKINYQELFEPIKELLNRPLKQIKINNSKNNYHQLVWMKRSTANLLSFGQVSQSMHDDVFYKERKRIVESYPKYEKDANIDVKEKKKPNCGSSVRLKEYFKKIDNLVNMNKTLMKNIYFKMKEK